MNSPRLLLRSSVLLSSIVLAAGCIAYRAGVFDGSRATRSGGMSGEKSALERAIFGGEADPSADAGDFSLRFGLGGTPLLDFIPPSSAEQSRTGSLLFMLGTKSDAGVQGSIRFDPPPSSASAPRPPARSEPAAFMSGTKSFAPDRWILGVTPAGTFTSDLDIPISPNEPPHGNAP